MDELPCRVTDRQDEEARILATLDDRVARTYLKYLLDRSLDLKQSPFEIVIRFSEYEYLAGHTGLFEVVEKLHVSADYKLTPFGEKVLRYGLLTDRFNLGKWWK